MPETHAPHHHHDNELHEEYRILLACLVLAVGSFAIVALFQPFGWGLPQFVQWGKEMVYWPVCRQFTNLVFTWGFLIALSATLLVEMWRPADPKQRIFGVSFWHDAVWFVYEAILQVFVLTIYVGALTALYRAHFQSLTIDSAAEWPFMLRLIVALVVSDFLYFVQHVLNHKVPWFWYLHMVHHSQKELNFFTDFRYHVLEYVVRNTVLTIPFLILGFEAPTVIWLAFFVKWYGRFCHGNIRTNLGPLRYVFVTPQSHRVHHSREERHVDMNYGSIFTFWDYAFRTQYTGWNEYPPTGVIGDGEFPHESKLRVSSLLVKPLQQMWYPLKLMGRDVRRKAQKLRGGQIL